MTHPQLALIRKDVRGFLCNRRTLSVILLVPLMLTVVLPSVFIIGGVLHPESLADFQVLLALLPSTGGADEQQLILGLILNKLMPIFFLMIPIMVSSVMAASSFVGEKEKHTLETLLYSPLTLKQLFHAKILSGLVVGIGVSYFAFAVMLLVVEAELLALTGTMLLPDAGWLVVLLLIAPALSLAAIAITVRSSARAQSSEESQQRAVLLIFPLLALIIGQFGGMLLIDTWLLLGLGAILVALDVLLMRGAAAKFTYETMLK